MVPKPTISFHGSGESVVLSNWGGGRFLLMQGASGLGMAQQELSTVALPQGGSVLLHRRRADAEVMVPLLLGGSYEERAEDRRRLERLCSGEVEVRVTQPDGSFRTRHGFYVDGLDGSYDAGEDSPDGQKLVLTFRCPDPLWYGSQQSEVWALSPDRMQFLSEMRDAPSTPRLVRTNHVLNPNIVGTFGRAFFTPSGYQGTASSASSELPLFGSSSWRLEVTDEDGVRVGGRLDTSAAGSMRYAAGLWMRPGPGVYSLSLYIQSDQSGGWRNTASRTVRSAPLIGQPIAQEWQFVSVEEPSAQAGNRRVTFAFSAEGRFTTGGGTEAIPVGSVSYVDGAVLTDASHSVEFFDGSTTVAGHTTNWTGAANQSASEQWTVPAAADDVLAVPFGTMRLSESTVQGAREVTIEGDADAEAVLVVTGPGEDLEVVNETTGQRVFIAGEIGEPITIDARPLVQDIYSESRQDGEWWQFVDDDAPLELITLKPGPNRIRVTMVNAHPDSSVELLYRETYHAGH